MDGKQIFENFTEGDTRGLRDAADGVSDLSSSYLERAQSIKALQDRMKQAWTGSGADAANAGAGPLEQAFAQTATPLDMTKASVDLQASSFDSSGHAVVPVPPKPESPSPWTTGLKAAIPLAGPFMAAGDLSSYQDSVTKYNAANDTNVRVMDQYSNSTDGTRSVLPADFGVLKSDGAPIALKTPSAPGAVGGPPVTTVPSKGGGGSGEQTSSSGYVQPGQGLTSDGSSGGSSGDETGGHTKPTGVVTPPVRSGPRADRTLPVGGKLGVGPTPPPTDVLPTPGRGQADQDGPGFGTAATGGRGTSAGGRPLDGESRVTGESARGQDTAKGSGLSGAAAARDGVVARARGGQPGPLGAAGRTAEGEEDAEHQRPDFLIEPDPDAVFGTDQRTSPPVIGE
ncbi:hypothetical protein [Amycolatopsis sp. H20-H5]|uniref:hypothetical protein n=1 Tax=Amycolatopsis sp. H20-H5 TaxID=3046309 RepID=UPI002DBC0048|nr:hypothetical protein [Amycolatopsis sp. H20-H5]MEC3979991.1 hypothetical protein [Amycolatopsis sp. H20-H5]